MRMVFGVLGLLVVLAIVGVLAKKQLTSLPAPAPATDATRPTGVTAPVQSKQFQQQYKQAVEAAIQPARPMPDDK
ncbi:MAG: hypothetical protein V4562_06780 [Pseudomonadota bacterium]